jgi:hypothetical protein
MSLFAIYFLFIWHLDSVLCGHLDDVEFDFEAPIVSIRYLNQQTMYNTKISISIYIVDIDFFCFSHHSKCWKRFKIFLLLFSLLTLSCNFCVSIGNNAVFLLGGRTNAEVPIAMLIRSGDVLIMGGYSRYPNNSYSMQIVFRFNNCFFVSCNWVLDPGLVERVSWYIYRRLCMHGVPRIIENTFPEEFLILTKTRELSPSQKAVIDYLRNKRININVRQVYKWM